MPTNNYPGIGKRNNGKDYDFYAKIDVTATTFGGGSIDGQQPDVFITFPTQTVIFLNEKTLGTNVVEYSFNGNTVHGELDPLLPSRGLMFDNRSIGTIWFRVKSGSAGPVTIRVDAWGSR